MNILVVLATETELAVLAPALGRIETLVCGVGMLETALALGRRLGRGPMPDIVVNLGIGGGFAAAGAGVLDICVASGEVIADFGVCRAPVVEPFNDSAVAAPWRFAASGRAAELVARGALPEDARTGTFVSVNAVTADTERAAVLWEQYAPVCENMEGAAVARVAGAFGLEWLEVRAVSNLVGPRDRATWRTGEALERLAACVPALVAGLAGHETTPRPGRHRAGSM